MSSGYLFHRVLFNQRTVIMTNVVTPPQFPGLNILGWIQLFVQKVTLLESEVLMTTLIEMD